MPAIIGETPAVAADPVAIHQHRVDSQGRLRLNFTPDIFQGDRHDNRFAVGKVAKALATLSCAG